MKYLSKLIASVIAVIIISLLICLGVSDNKVYKVYANENENINGGEYYQSNPNFRIGLVFGSGMVESFQTSAANGFAIGTVKVSASDYFTSFCYIKNTKISVSHMANLSKNAAGRYYANNKNIVVGKYSLEFEQTFSNFAEAYNFINTVPAALNMFPAYINNKIVVRLGDFSSAENANAYISKVQGYGLSVTSDSANTAVVINPETDEILFEFYDGDNNLAITAALAADIQNIAYGRKIAELSMKTTDLMATSANNTYSGAFVYRINSSGVEVIGLMSLEDYVKGVVPNEISPSWEKEALKAFAIAARTYALNSGNRHESDGFMLCNETHCQLYSGLKNATNDTNNAVDETKDLVITYNNEPIIAVYHSSSGGVTENHNDAWGGTLRYPYLVSVPLPFEKYTDPSHKNALWTKSASPSELFEYLTQISSYSSLFKGKLTSSVASIRINQRSPGSNYIKSITVTDTSGHSVTVEKSDSVRAALSRYANSANMDIYKSFKFKSVVMSALSGSTYSQDIEAGKTYIATGNGVTKSTPGDGTLSVLSGNGLLSVKAYASGNDFIFDGKGWGHGVGMSQWAVQDLAELGYKYEDIIKTFYTGVSIDNITNLKRP